MRKSSNLKTNDCGEVYIREGLLMAVLEREKEERERDHIESKGRRRV